MPVLSELAQLGGYGVFPHERAAFVVRDHDGAIACVLWPPTNQFQRASVRTVIPAGTIAIAHTHPMSSPAASEHDREEARRLMLPIVVVGRSSLQWVDIDGKITASRSGVVWMKQSRAQRLCSVRPEPESKTARREPAPAQQVR
jgi:hypothetical protein